MEALIILEERLAALISIATRLKEDNRQLRSDIEVLKSENVNLVHNNTELTALLELQEESSTQECKEIDKLHQEKRLTKSAVDDLIKSIESLVEKENQL